MKRNRVLSIILLAFLLVLCCVAASCTTVLPSVTFDAQNGTQPQKVLFINFTMPADPTREGYVFGGWYTDANCTAGNEWTAPETLSQSITVYAKWTIDTQNIYVYFNARNGSELTAVKFDENFKMPADPTMSGYTFDGWYSDIACTDGNEWTKPQTLSASITVYAKWKSEHDFGDNYLMFVTCADEGCNVVGRNISTDSAKAKFVYDFSSAKKEEIDGHYQALLTNLGKVSESDYEDMFNEYDSDVSYVMEQYQYAYVFYSAYNDSQATADYEYISEFYNECIANYYGLFEKVYQSSYRNEFFAGWTQDELDEILALSKSYGDESYVRIKNDIDSILVEYNAMLDTATSAQLTTKYKQLVELNNQLAALSGYDNYLDYAYDVVYGRDYTPEETVTMRNYVKNYIGKSLDNAVKKYRSVMLYDNANYNYYAALAGASVFGASSSSERQAVNLMGQYLKQMTSSAGSKDIDFYKYANEIMKNGNYYLGEQSGAFSYWIPNQNTSILYFSDEEDDGFYSYQNVFTFVHEFGHYYNGVYNNGLSLSMDHDETQSQGNEMLFLAWLSQNKPNKISDGYTALQYEQLAEMLSTICISTAVDEFEYAVYTDSYNGKSVKDNYSDYGILFEEILGDYGTYMSGNGNTAYWSYVVFDNAGYYISYAMSALPSVEIFVNAMSDFASAKASYLKLFTFSDNDDLVATDSNGDKTVTASYQTILNWAGLQGPFQQALYTTIYNYFK